MKITVTVDQSEHGHVASVTAETGESHVGEVARIAHDAVYAALIAAGFHPSNVEEYVGPYER